MQLNRKTLAFVQLPDSKGDLYTPSSGTRGLVHNIVIHNTNTTTETVSLNYHDGTNEYEILNQNILAGDTLVWDFRGAGDIVEEGAKYTGNTTTAAKVTFKVSGTEETPSPSTASIIGVSSNLWVPPGAPNAADDEFNGSALDSAWAVHNTTDDVAGSLSADTVDAYDTTTTTGNVINYVLNGDSRPSWLLLQPPARLKRYQLYKAYTYPTNVLIVARLRFSMGAVAAATSEIGITVTEDDGGGDPGNEATNNYLECMLANAGASTMYSSARIWNAGTPGTEFITTDVDTQGQALEYVAIHKISNNYYCWVGTASGNWHQLGPYTSVAWTPTLVTIKLRTADTARFGIPVQGIDFIRFYETSNFLF